MEEEVSIGTRLKELRAGKKISDQKLVNDLKRKGYSFSRDLINKWENGSRTPNAEAIIALSRYYGVPSDYILGISPSPVSDDCIQTTAMTLGFSEKATENLLNLGFINGDTASGIFSDILESPLLEAVMGALSESKLGIMRQDSYCTKADKIPADFINQCCDLGDMFILRALRETEKLLREVLGYNALEKRRQK